MIRKDFWQKLRAPLFSIAVFLGLGLAARTMMGPKIFVQTALSGLTLGALYFMVASGLTLIFGLMGVLNFAHGAMFMAGAYAGWQFYTNPTFIFGLAPLVFAFLTGQAAGSLLQPPAVKLSVPKRWQGGLRLLLTLAALAMGVLGLSGLDILGLAETAMVAIAVAADPLAEATSQEPLIRFWLRPILLTASGLILALGRLCLGNGRQPIRKKRVWPQWAILGAAIGALLLGLARAFGDFLALNFKLSPAISEASTVIIMAVVLLVRPAGLFGRKE